MRWYSVAVALLAALALLASTVQAVDVHQAPKKAQLQSNRFGEPVGDAKTKPAVTSVPPVVPDIVDLLEKKKALQQLVNNYKTKISQNKAAIEQAKKDIAAATELKSQAEHNVTTLKFQVESTHAQLIFVQRNVTDLKVKVQGWDLAKLKALAYHAMNANPPSESGAFEAARSNLHEADVRVTGLYNDLLVISDFISEKVYGPGHVPHSTELQNLLESIAAVEKQIKGVEAKVLDQKGKMSNIEMIVKKHDEVIESYNQLILKAKPLIKQLEELLIQIKSPKQTCPCMKHCPQVDHCSCKDGKLHYKGEVLATVVSKGSIDNCSPTRTVANAGKQF